MAFAIFRRLRRLIAAAVGEGAIVGIKGARVFELVVKFDGRLRTVKALFICVSTSWAFS